MMTTDEAGKTGGTYGSPLIVLVDNGSGSYEECEAFSTDEAVMFKRTGDGVVWGIMRKAFVTIMGQHEKEDPEDEKNTIVLGYKDGDVVKSIRIRSRPDKSGLYSSSELEYAPGFISMALMLYDRGPG